MWKYYMDPIYEAQDHFARHLKAIAKPIVPISDKQLLSDAGNHSDPAVREYALLEYSYRYDQSSFGVLLDFWQGETDRDVRKSLFEELVRLDGKAFKHYLELKGVPKDIPELARAYYNAPLGGVTRGKRLDVKSDEKEIFDQTIPLRVALREYVEVEPGKWMYHLYGPIQEKRVAGQLLACTKVETRMDRVVLTKHLEGLHTDGSLHIESTLFTGRTVMRDDVTGVASMRTMMKIPFYPSGRVGDESEGVITDANILVARAATWQLNKDIQIRDHYAINNVTGIIHAWGYTRPDKATFDPSGRMDLIAGLFHLGDIIDERVRPYINTYTIGAYYGNIEPDVKGIIGLNTLPSYTTLDGEIDRDRDGIAETPGEHYDRCPGVHPIDHYKRDNDPRSTGPKTKYPLKDS
ncbi:hypothetical protein [Changchengzhania lutea]|uniref:hypothetical protein n=1 Tax=Changchengzhania lutea TaxID=2049305 RepID=UPI00115CD5C9|nr:hypothetical protein [Changchengzhania lutea]